ncbi:MAG: hypothetical protein RL291_1586 [Pseudomonadota bacterium]|jgi:hypothetical protein
MVQVQPIPVPVGRGPSRQQRSLLGSIPLLIIPLVLYFLLAFWQGGELLGRTVFRVPMLRGGVWGFTWGDLILLLTLICLFFEILRATRVTRAHSTDHIFSMIVFILALLLFLMVPLAATSIFFFIVAASLFDVTAGFSIGLTAARRDFNIGGDA